MRGLGAVDDPVALLARLIVLQCLRDTAPEREGRVGRRGTAGRIAAIARSLQRRDVGRTGLVDRLVQRAFVGVAVEGRSVDVAVVNVARDHQCIVVCVAGRQVEQRGAVLRDVRLGVHAGTVTLQQTLLLQPIAVELVVCMGQCQLQVGVAAGPAQLAEPLAHIRW